MVTDPISDFLTRVRNAQSAVPQSGGNSCIKNQKGDYENLI